MPLSHVKPSQGARPDPLKGEGVVVGLQKQQAGEQHQGHSLK